MRILITGTTGFIGAHLLRHLSKSGHELIAWSRPKYPPNGLTSFAKYQAVDLLKEVPRLSVDACIHCAGYANDKGDWDTFYENNVVTTQNLFEAIQTPLWINISSSSIYPITSKVIKELDVDVNNFPSLYGKSKYLAEKLMEDGCGPDQTVFSLRPRAVYGENDRVLLPRILNIGKNGVIKLPGGGDVKLSMTHVKNLIHAVELCLHSKLKGFHAYNVGDSKPYILREVMQKINEGFLDKHVEVKSVSPALVRNIIKFTSLFGKPFPLSMQAFDYITTPTVIDVGKIKNELGYNPNKNFFDEVNEITKWARSIPKEILYAGDKGLAWMNFNN